MWNQFSQSHSFKTCKINSYEVYYSRFQNVYCLICLVLIALNNTGLRNLVHEYAALPDSIINWSPYTKHQRRSGTHCMHYRCSMFSYSLQLPSPRWIVQNMTAIARWGNDLGGAEKYGVPQPALGDLGNQWQKETSCGRYEALHVCRRVLQSNGWRYRFIFGRSQVRISVQILATPRNFCFPQTIPASSGLLP